MGHNRRPGGRYVVPVKQSDGSKSPDEVGRGTYMLASDTTYLYPLGGIDAPLEHAQVKWDASAILTIQVETCDFGDADVTDVDIAAGNWIHEDPTTGYISVKSHDNTTGGATVTNASISVAGGTAGGCSIHLGNNGAARSRLAVTVGGTGGNVTVAATSKSV